MKPDNSQVERFHFEIVELIKKYQFRDRNEMVCCGLSVSQCYTLETLNRFGTMSMKALADRMYLSISTITRVIDPLIKQKFVVRKDDKSDRRVKLVRLTRKGENVVAESWKNVFRSEQIILQNFPGEHRELFIEFLQKLNQAFGNWKESRCNYNK